MPKEQITETSINSAEVVGRSPSKNSKRNQRRRKRTKSLSQASSSDTALTSPSDAEESFKTPPPMFSPDSQTAPVVESMVEQPLIIEPQTTEESLLVDTSLKESIASPSFKEQCNEPADIDINERFVSVAKDNISEHAPDKEVIAPKENYDAGPSKGDNLISEPIYTPEAQEPLTEKQPHDKMIHADNSGSNATEHAQIAEISADGTSLHEHSSLSMVVDIKMPEAAELETSFDTEADKEDFFERLQNSADATIDYGRLNQMLPDDSADYSIGDQTEELKGTRTILPEHISSAFPLTVPTTDVPLPPSVPPKTDMTSARSLSSEEHDEDLASIQSNIDFIEKSDVFHEGDISIADSTTSVEDYSAQDTSILDERPLPALEKKLSKVPKPQRSEKSPAVSTYTNIRASQTSKIRNSNSSKMAKNKGPAMGTEVTDGNSSVFSNMSVEVVEQREREIQFMGSLLDKAQQEAAEAKEKLVSVLQHCTQLEQENELLLAETADLRQTLALNTVDKKPDDKKKTPDEINHVVQQQEQLIEGFQKENEKLVVEVSNWKIRLNDAQTKAKAREDELRQEILQLQTKVREKPSGRESTMSRAREEEYESRIEDMAQTFRQKELELKIQIDELTQARDRAIKDPTGELSKKHESEIEAITEKHQQELQKTKTELISKTTELEQFKAVGISFDRDRGDYEETINSLRMALDLSKTEVAKVKRDNEVEISNLKSKLQQADSRLEKELKALKEANLRNTNLQRKTNQLEEQIKRSVPERTLKSKKSKEITKNTSKSSLVEVPKPLPDEPDIVTELQNRIQLLEEERQSMQDEITRLTPFEREHEQMKGYYEREVKDLKAELELYREKADNLSLQLLQNGSDSAPLSSADAQNNPILRDVIQGLRDDIRWRVSEEKLLKKEADDYRLKYFDVSAQVQQHASTAKHLENTLQQLRDNLIETQKKLGEQQGRQSDPSVLQSLRDEIQTLTKSKSELQQKLDANEAIRQSMHENFLIILRQSQEEITRSAMDHHERALKILREENRASALQLIAEETKRWREQLNEAESEASHWKVRSESLEGQIQDLKLHVRHLESELELTQTRLRADPNGGMDSRPGSMSPNRMHPTRSVYHEFEEAELRKEIQMLRESQNPDEEKVYLLLKRISEMEARFNRREQHWKRFMDEQPTGARSQAVVDELKRKYQSTLERKNEEIRRFKKELDFVLRELELLRSR